MNPKVSSDAFNTFFAWAPLVVGLAIYLVFYIAKRKECAATPGIPAPSISAEHTFVCGNCGRLGTRDAMVAQDHGGAVEWRCAQCAAQTVAS